MKGEAIGGVAYLPEHPDADLNGLIRVCLREASEHQARLKLEECQALHITPAMWNTKIWKRTNSQAELLATSRNYGIVLACSLTLQYLSPENYRAVPREMLKIRKKAESARKP